MTLQLFFPNIMERKCKGRRILNVLFSMRENPAIMCEIFGWITYFHYFAAVMMQFFFFFGY